MGSSSPSELSRPLTASACPRRRAAWAEQQQLHLPVRRQEFDGLGAAQLLKPVPVPIDAALHGGAEPADGDVPGEPLSPNLPHASQAQVEPFKQGRDATPLGVTSSGNALAMPHPLVNKPRPPVHTMPGM